MRTTLRTAAVALTAAVVLPVLPAAVAPTAASAAVRPAATAAAASWLVRDARAKTTVAHVARRHAAAARWTFLASAPDQREANRAAAAYAARDARAKGIIAHLARRKADALTRVSAPRASRSAARTAAPRTTGTGVWDRLAQCESGGNWGISTGNGYYGGVQFSLSSWRAVGGTGYPHHASRAEQIVRAERLKANQGWGAWPSCTRKLGLR